MSLRCMYSQFMAGMSGPMGFVAIMLLPTFLLFQPLESNEWVLFLLFLFKLFIIFCFITQRRKSKQWRWTVRVFLPHTWSTGVKSTVLAFTLAQIEMLLQGRQLQGRCIAFPVCDAFSLSRTREVVYQSMLVSLKKKNVWRENCFPDMFKYRKTAQRIKKVCSLSSTMCFPYWFPFNAYFNKDLFSWTSQLKSCRSICCLRYDLCK